MLPHAQLQGNGRAPLHPIHESFLDGEADTFETPQTSDGLGSITFTAQGHSRAIGAVIQHYNGPTFQHYDSNPRQDYSPVLEWLWPRPEVTKANPALAQYKKQYIIHKSASEARKGQISPWIFKRPSGDAFVDWLESTGGNLWLWGKIGCGKTVLFSAIVKHIESLRRTQRTIRLCYYYCRFQNDVEGELILLLRKWLVEISEKSAVPSALQTLYELCHESYPARDPTSEELEEVLLEVLRANDTNASRQAKTRIADPERRFFLLVDALDEIPSSDDQSHQVLEMLSRIASARLHNTFIFVTSRDRSDIGEYLKPIFVDLRMDYDAVDEDIGEYVPRAIMACPGLNRQSAETKIKITERLANQAKGMFLWAALQMRLLRALRVKTDGTIEHALSTLPMDLNETYERIFSSIDRSLASKALLALKWIVLAKRPLFIEEVVEVCAFKAGRLPSLETDSKRLQAYNLFELLQDLVVIEPHLDIEESGTRAMAHVHTVTLAHFSLSEYLSPAEGVPNSNRIFQISPSEDHALIAKSCLSYLYHFNTKTNRENANVLLEYAWYNWEKHIITCSNAADEQVRVRRKAMQLYEIIQGWSDLDPSCDPSSHSEISNQLLESLDWLPQGEVAKMVQALGIPYFHPNIDEFLAERISEEDFYEPLSQPTDIRLLYLLPSLDKRRRTLCRMARASLGSLPEFSALSYVWGGRDIRHSVCVNGFKIKVTRNLSEILATLCAQEFGQAPALWVDAICINRLDLSERGHQVSLVGEIYRKAKEVVLSIGGDLPGDEEGIQALTHLGSVDTSQVSRSRAPLTDDQREGIFQIFDHEFWKRMWTIQELALARRGTMLVGSLSISIDVIEEVFRRVLQPDSTHRDDYDPSTCLFLRDNRLRYARGMILTRIQYKARGRLELPELLCRFRHHPCTVPQDKIYSVLGLIGYMCEELRPDYSKNAYDAFLDAAVVNLRHYGVLNILSHVSDDNDIKLLEEGLAPLMRDSDPELPYRKRPEEPFRARLRTFLYGGVGPSWLPTYQHRRTPFVSCEKAAGIFKAGGDASVRVHIERSSEIARLKVAGREVDWVASTFSGQDRSERGLQAMISYRGARLICSIVEFWDVLLAGQSYDGCRLAEGSVNGVRVPPTTTEEESIFLQSGAMQHWPNFIAGRKLFLTASGVLGLGPQCMREGDVVVVFAGGPVPYVLRRTCEEDCGDCFRFVGECYLHGFMDGKAVQGHEDDETFWETFCIH